MASTAAPVADTALPVVLIVSVEEMKRNAGKVWREVARGAVVRVDDVRSAVTVGWLSGEVPASVAALTGYLPAPGAVADHLAPE